MNLNAFQAWLNKIAEEKRARERAARYTWARYEEFYLPLDAHQVPVDIAIGVAQELGLLRLQWQREGK
jgi:hypothetical protein